jgi:hypothetical protein
MRRLRAETRAQTPILIREIRAIPGHSFLGAALNIVKWVALAERTYNTE